MTRPRTRSLLLIATLAALVALPAAVVAKQPAGIGSTATARVFMPNPVASLDDQTLTDQKDADYAALAPAYAQRDPDRPRRQRLPVRSLGLRRQRDR